VLARERNRFRTAARLHGLEPSDTQHVPGELPVLLAVVDDQDERVFRLCGWRRRRHRRILTPMPIRLVLAEDQYFVREGIRRLLETQDELEVVAVCGDLDSLLAAVDAERPDVVVTDIRMPPGNGDEGIQVAVRLRETNPDVGVVVLSQYATPSFVLALLEGGSERRAYLLKERVKDVEQLVAAIRAVAEGGSVMDPKVVEALVAENARSEESPLSQLTPRERDVLREMAEGKNNAAIAASLFLTERSVEKVIHSIFLKLGLTWEPAVHKRVKAVILYLAQSA
jgi:DNA-binding NarL/FixJ family response regulator